MKANKLPRFMLNQDLSLFSDTELEEAKNWLMYDADSLKFMDLAVFYIFTEQLNRQNGNTSNTRRININ